MDNMRSEEIKLKSCIREKLLEAGFKVKWTGRELRVYGEKEYRIYIESEDFIIDIYIYAHDNIYFNAIFSNKII